jgi:hypothetical protein
LVALAIGALAVGVLAAPAGAATTTVGALSVNGWFGGNEGPAGSSGTVSLVSGPGTPDAGTGSAKLTVDGTGRASLGTNGFKGTKLSQISALSYSTYATSSQLSHQANLQFDVDFDTTDASTAYQGRLSFGTDTSVPLNTWTSVNALTDGKWYGSQLVSPAPCSQSSPCTWAQVLTAYPNAGVRNDPVEKGAMLLRLGGPVTGGGSVYVDNFSITRPSGTSTVDFEPGATVTPTVGVAGTAINVTAYGYRPGAKVAVKFDRVAAGLHNGPRQLRICKVTANTNGVITCNTSVPAVSGPPGVHPITLKGKGANGAQLKYKLDFIISP